MGEASFLFGALSMASIADTRKQDVSIDRARYQRITRFFAGLILHLVWWDIILRRLAGDYVLETRPQRWRGLSRRFRQVAVEMGGVLIKLGQFLSTRVDVLPPVITDELKGLQDEVPAVPMEAIFGVLAQELGDVNAHFSAIEEQPLAAASLGQVHRAWLNELDDDGTEESERAVVVKVQRPGIERLVQTDLAALRVVARWIMRYRPIRRRVDMPALLEEFAQTLWEELDYVLEAANAVRFAEMFADDEGVYIPYVYRSHSTRRVLVLENVEAIKIIDLDAMDGAGIDRRQVADRLLDTYFRQIFYEGFFHADPHPGNLFIQPLGQENGDGQRFQLIFVDFGMVGHIEALMGEKLNKLLVSVTQKDAEGLTQAFSDLGFFLPGADLQRINEAVARLLDDLWGRNLMELAQPDPKEVQALTREFRDILFAFPVQAPQDFLYLGRAMGILAGLATLLDPQINPWYKLEQYGRALIRSQKGQQALWDAAVEVIRPLVELPLQLQRVLSAAEKGKLRVEAVPDRRMMHRLERLERKMTQLQATVLAVAGMMSALLFYLSRKRDGK